MSSITYVGMDAHKKAINIVVLPPRKKKPQEWTVANEPRAIKRAVRKIVKDAKGEVRCCYEAGPCGYALQRTIEGAGPVVCSVVAPSLIPVKPGEKIKTDKRDARKLAELLRADLLTEVSAPTPQEESARDMCRAREDIRGDLKRAKQRMAGLVLRRGLIYPNRGTWTQEHKRWLRSIDWENEADKVIFDAYWWAIEHNEERIKLLDEKIERLSKQEPYAEPVGWLRCFRGIDTTTAMVIVTELHGFSRFESPRALMSYLGLVPGEHSSGDKTRRLGITKTGNKHVRRILVEAAWHYRHKPAVGSALRKRRNGQPAEVIALAERAQMRLHRRYWRLTTGMNKPPNKATVAVARELAGFIWALLYPRAAELGHA